MVHASIVTSEKRKESRLLTNHRACAQVRDKHTYAYFMYTSCWFLTRGIILVGTSGTQASFTHFIVVDASVL